MGMPKALVTDERGSWLVRGVDLLHEGGCRRVTVVLGAEVARAGALLVDLDVDLVVADDWAEGMGASLRTGLRSLAGSTEDRKSTRLNSSHMSISYAVFCLKKKKKKR